MEAIVILLFDQINDSGTSVWHLKNVQEFKFIFHTSRFLLGCTRVDFLNLKYTRCTWSTKNSTLKVPALVLNSACGLLPDMFV
mmetsp:Transcript_18335/g.25772  ORF Transcript_18335/g.25772 Transcript_18335/m.25772 type:complete len:83 (-) Transcript_18335:60-308(-)